LGIIFNNDSQISEADLNYIYYCVTNFCARFDEETVLRREQMSKIVQWYNHLTDIIGRYVENICIQTEGQSIDLPSAEIIANRLLVSIYTMFDLDWGNESLPRYQILMAKLRGIYGIILHGVADGSLLLPAVECNDMPWYMLN
jgi:hypothetical protein